ncbi:hypothetical protein [Streptomyces sp. NPDC058412]|uniref:hypothetical protein n=1 Tax=Streptomyces sp. NPDC058412 TaxID=3346486 RepID=UPI00365AD550
MAKPRKKTTHQNGAQHTNITDTQSSSPTPSARGSSPIPLPAAMNSSGTSVQAPKYHRADRPAGHSFARMARRVAGPAAQKSSATTTTALSSANQGANTSPSRTCLCTSHTSCQPPNTASSSPEMTRTAQARTRCTRNTSGSSTNPSGRTGKTRRAVRASW